MNERLMQLESEGKHVFHGSPKPDIEILEPRQSTHVPDYSKPTESILDGAPAVSATPYAQMAIFRSIINGSNIDMDHTSGFGFDNEGIFFSVSHDDVLKRAEGKDGYVYVFDKKDFAPYTREGEDQGSNFEWRSYKPVKPVEVIKVGHEHLPKKIKVYKQ